MNGITQWMLLAVGMTDCWRRFLEHCETLQSVEAAAAAAPIAL